ncbi:hypothetical protein PV327_005525 [Microctonus hyperodae]|uniref:C3H1-type domain-containing protein n=1 Tax=Microctonus hyperodae TaxID=165561 RepID=A0AA39G1T9_MICHY|nr:hypothetical protein PV327_005525 [Microctonus hyperodae]
MSKSNIRKITVDPTKCNADPRRPSVFERLGTKPVAVPATQITTDYCRNWASNGNCSYGKSCKYANTHTLISPSKRAKKDTPNASVVTTKEDPFKRVTSKIVKKTSHSPDLNLEEWNQTDLEYEDEKVLERRRQLLQRELELQMKKDKEVHGKDKIKHKKRVMSSSSSSHSSSSSSSSSSSTSDDSSSSSTSDSRKKLKKIKAKRHHSASSEYEEDKDRKRKLKLKRLSAKNDKTPVKKKRRIEVPTKKEIASKTPKKSVIAVSRKHPAITKTRSPAPAVAAHVASTSKIKERNRSESPKAKIRECDREQLRHHRKGRDLEDLNVKDLQKTSKTIDKTKELEKTRVRVSEVEKMKLDERPKIRLKEKECRSRTPPIERPRHQQQSKEIILAKSRRSRTPEKPSKTKRDTPPPRHQEKVIITTSNKSREMEKKEREMHKRDRSKEREEIRKNELIKSSRIASNVDDIHKKNINREMDDKSHLNERNRQKNREHRDKDHIVARDDRIHARISGSTRSDPREKERDDIIERVRERPREREREKEPPIKPREREIPMISSVALSSGMDKISRYAREKERIKESIVTKDDKLNTRDRRNEREREVRAAEIKLAERDKSSQRFEVKYDRTLEKDVATLHKPIERERIERFPRERSLERPSDSKTVLPSREHLPDRETLYERGNRHRRINPRYERGGHSVVEHERKDIPPTVKMERGLPERRESPRRSLEVERNFDRGYSRLSTDHWSPQDDPPPRAIDYHLHEEERRKPPVETRTFNSPFNERRSRDDRPPPPPPSRYAVQGERPFDEHHHPHYSGSEKLRPGTLRDESSSDNWEMHHDVEQHSSRDRVYPPAEWEEREWRPRTLWDRESLPRSEAHEEEWTPRYDSPMSDWKINDSRKWENPRLHMRVGYGNDRLKEAEIIEGVHGKRRPPYGTPEIRDECASHGPKQTSLHGNMKEEPINKKLMELAEGRPRKSREKSADIVQKKQPPPPLPPSLPPPTPKEKITEPKEPPQPIVEPKRPCLEENISAHHTESDLSDISDDPDDILNMEDEEEPEVKKPVEIEKELEVKPMAKSPNEEVKITVHASPEQIVEEPTVLNKDKEELETPTVEDDNMHDETMDFEEISDGELEEDIKTSGKGLGDALGVDWESLVKESQPRRPMSHQDSAQCRWQCKAIFKRIGISVKYAKSDFMDKVKKKYDSDDKGEFLLDNIAMLHSALLREKITRDPGHNLLIPDDSLYRINDEDKYDDEGPDVLKAFTSLFEEAKQLLKQNS